MSVLSLFSKSKPNLSLSSKPLTTHSEFASHATGSKTYTGALWRIVALPAYHLVLLACGAVLLPHISYVSWWLVLLAFVSVLAQLPSVKHAIGQKFRLNKSYKILQFVVFLSGVAGLWLSAGQFSSEFSIGFLVLCLFCKLWELNTKRDAYVVLNLCLFVLASAFLWSQSLGFALVAMMGLVCVMLGFVGLADEDNVAGVGRVRTVSLLLLPSIPLLVVLFLFFPRLPPLWALPLSSKQATTGVSDSMSPGDFANLSKSTELAFRVEFDGALPRRDELYWRGLVFTEFDGTTWRAGQVKDYWRSNDTTVPSWATMLQGHTPSSYQVILEPTQQNWLFALDYSRPHAQRGVAMNSHFALGSYYPISSQFRYRLDYYPDVKVGLTPDEDEYRSALTLPKTGNPKAQALAKSLYAQAGGDTRAMVGLIQKYIVDNAFSYTLSPPLLQDNRIDEFLFGTRAGFCEHYASSFTYLMRSAGVPARVVVGYQGGELGRDGKSWEVRQMDAHAWTEVWIENEGWVRVDPTGFVSPERIFDGMNAVTESAGASMFGDGVVAEFGYRQFRLLQSMYRLSDQAGYYWQKQIVGFDQETQKNSLWQWFNITSLAKQVMVLAGAFVGLVGLIVGVLWYQRRQRYEPFDAPIAKLAKQLAKHDIALAKSPHESYLGYLGRLADNCQNADEWRELVSTYRQHRFGQHGLPNKAYKAQAVRFGKSLQALKSAILNKK